MAIATPPQIVTQPAGSTAAYPATGVLASVAVHAAAISIALAAGWSQRADVMVQPGEAAAQQQLTLQIAAAPASSALRAQLEPAKPPPAAQAATLAEDRAPEDVGRLLAELPPVAPIEVLRPPLVEPDPVPDAPPKKVAESAEPDAAENAETEKAEATEPLAAPAQQAQSAAEPQVAGAKEVGAAVDSLPRTVDSNQPPAFPPAALAERRGGKVVLRVTVAADGHVSSLSVLHSSGHTDLDNAAVEAVRRWKFIPAMRDGRGVRYEVAVPIRFTFES